MKDEKIDITEAESVSQVSARENLKCRKKEFVAWKFFDQIKEGYQCNIWQKHFSSTFSTGTLKNNYNSKHKNQAKKNEKEFSEFFKGSSIKKEDGDLLIRWIFKSMQPWSVVDESPFR